MSKKGMDPSSLASSTVNCMALSTGLIWCRNSSLCAWSCITQVSSTYLLQNLGGCTAVDKALDSNASMNMLATIGFTGEPMAAPLGLLIEHPLECEVGVI